MSSMNNLSVDGEFRYIVTWFTEWSVLQREDFVPILVSWLTHDAPSPDGVYINGVASSVANAEINDKPMSLFQCRIKLFNQWSPKWPQDFKYKLKEKIIEIDSKVGEKIINEIKGHSNGNADNGIDEDEMTLNENESGEETTENANRSVNAVVAAELIVADSDVGTEEAVVVDETETEAAINADNQLAAVLNNETPVDDDDDVDDDAQNTVATRSDSDTPQQLEEEPAKPVEMQQTQEEPVVAASAAATVTVTVANSAAEVPSIA